MPCTVCCLLGHNKRTCTKQSPIVSVSDPSFNVITSAIVVDKPHFCYVLQQVDKSKKLRNYIGYTVNPKRRIRQHNGLISGGARFTKNKSWEYLMIFSCPTWNSTRGLQVEWLIKHPLRKKRRSPLFKGSLGTVQSLTEIIKRIPSDEILSIYVHGDYYEIVNKMVFPSNVHILHMNDLLL